MKAEVTVIRQLADDGHFLWLRSKKENMPRLKLHLICNAHLDPVWQWRWEEGGI